MTAVVGAAMTAPFSSTTDGRMFSLGDSRTDHAGKKWVFVKAASAIDANDLVSFDTLFSAASAAIGTVALGHAIGVAPYAFAADEYGWVCVHGAPVTVNVSGTATASTQLYVATGTGALSTTASSATLEGVVLITGSSATAVQQGLPVLLNWPHFKSL